MSKQKEPQAVYFNEDYPVVVLGAHLTKEEAIKLAEHDLGEDHVDYKEVERVHHWYVQYQFLLEEDNGPRGSVDGKIVSIGGWFLRKKQPKGVFRKATVLEWLP